METQQVIDGLDGFYSLVDTNAKHLLLNQIAANWLGFGSPEQGIGLSYSDIKAPAVESKDFFLELDQTVLQTGKKIFYLGYFGYHDGYRIIQGCK